jgi:hypothetical protein
MSSIRNPALGRFASQGRALAASVVVACALGAMAIAYYPFNQAEDGGARAILIVSGIVVATAAVVFGPVTTRALAGRTARTALVLAGLGLLTVPVLWLGFPLVLGPAGVLLGRHARATASPGTGRRQATAAIVVGSLAWLLGIVGALLPGE